MLEGASANEDPLNLASLSFTVDLPLLIPYVIPENGYLKSSF